MFTPVLAAKKKLVNRGKQEQGKTRRSAHLQLPERVSQLLSECHLLVGLVCWGEAGHQRQQLVLVKAVEAAVEHQLCTSHSSSCCQQQSKRINPGQERVDMCTKLTG